jgi:shikimate dehydrogenase
LIREAGERGVATVDGLEILVCQGALSFTLWTGLPAPRQIMRAAARARPPDIHAS